MKSENEETKSMAGAKIAMGFIMLILIAVMLTCVFANRYLDMINREAPATNVAADSESIGGENRMQTVKSIVKPIDDSKLVNVLLVGQDSVPGDDIKRSDSMILCSVNPETKELVMVSFLRDLYVEIPGYAPNRLNTAYALGGFELLKQTLGYNFGVSIDGCFGVNFEGFSKIADTLGGVDIELSTAEAEIIGGGLTAGMNHLNGRQVLEYTRIRKLDSDFGRTERQRNVLSAMLEGMKDSSAGDIIGLAEEILPCMTSDMSNAEIMSVLLQCYPALDSDVDTCHVPGEGAYHDANINGMAVLVPDRQMIRQQLENELPL